MKIGIDGSRAFIKNRTGIEEYSYQVIKHLRAYLGDHQVRVYLRAGQTVDFSLPPNWTTRVIVIPKMWTQLGLSAELLVHPVDVLFVPGHTVPWRHPKRTVVTIHGLEYEIVPETYSWWERFYMRTSIKKSCQWAKRIITVSRNTKQDLQRLYAVKGEKTYVVYEGYEQQKTLPSSPASLADSITQPYFLFIGRLEKRKNIERVIEAFSSLKQKNNLPHHLVLAGRPGYGYKNIKHKIESSKYAEEIIETGYISEEEKWALLKKADIFLFPTLYEGFGLPVLEAQSLGVPVVASNVASLPEVGGDGVAYCNPEEPVSIVEAISKILTDEIFRDDIIKKGQDNISRFSWEKCAENTARLLTDWTEEKNITE